MKSTQPIKAVAARKNEELDIDFQQYWLILKRRWLPATTVFAAVMVVVGLSIARQKPMYSTQGKLLIKPDNTASLTGLKVEGSKDLTPLTMQGNPLKTETEILLSNDLLKKTITSLNLRDKKGKLIDESKLKADIEVKNLGGTDVLQISSTSANAKEAADIVNTLMNLYIENNVNINRSQASTARNFLTKQLPATELAVREAEANLRQFKEKNQVVSLDQEATQAANVDAELKKKIAETQAKLEDTNAQSAALLSKLGMSAEQAMAVNTVSQSNAVQTVITDLQKIENQLAIEQSRFQQENPQIIALKTKESELKALLQERIGQTLGSQQTVSNKKLQAGLLEQKLIEELIKTEVSRFGLSSQVNSLVNMQNAYKQRASNLPKLEQDQRELKRRLEAAQSTYETLLKKLQEVQVAENQTIGNARIIDKALVPTTASLGKKPAMMGMGGGVAGIVLALVVMVILEIGDKSLKNSKEAKKLFKYTLVGSIPLFSRFEKAFRSNSKSKQSGLKIHVRDTPNSVVSEAYWKLQANLEILDSDQEAKVIVVASSVPKEGNSTVAANLAVTLAELGKQVLLVDANMRHPSQHQLWDLSNEEGLSNVILGQVDLQLVTKKVLMNLEVLTSGVTPLNPVTILKSQEMLSLIKYASKNYDFVIFDTPPLMHAADALILGKLADGILLVTRPGVVDHTSILAVKESLDQSGQNVLGLVINGVIPKNEADNQINQMKKYHHNVERLNQKNTPQEPRKKSYPSKLNTGKF